MYMQEKGTIDIEIINVLKSVNAKTVNVTILKYIAIYFLQKIILFNIFSKSKNLKVTNNFH